MATQPQFNYKSRRGLLLAGVFAVTAWAAYPQLVQQSVAPPPVPTVVPSVVKPSAASDSRLLMPAGFQQAAVVRDPFQMPKEALPPTQSFSGNTGRATQQPPALPQYQLTGVAIGNGTAAAILESSAGSRSYRVGEYAGPFQIRRITSDSVVLVGPNGPHVLNMRR